MVSHTVFPPNRLQGGLEGNNQGEKTLKIAGGGGDSRAKSAAPDQEVYILLGVKLSKRDTYCYSLVSIAHSSLYLRPGNGRLESCFQRAYCLLHNVKKQAIGGSPGLLCALAPSYMNMTVSSGSKLSLACTRNSLNRTVLIPPRYAKWKSQAVGDMAKQTVTLRPL